MRTFFVITTIFVSMLTLFALPLQAAAQATDPETVLRGIFEDALNVKDIDRALASVADDAVITIIQGPNQIVFTGKDEIRGWWQQTQVAENTFIQVSNVHVDGDTVTWLARVAADPFRALGVDFVNCTCETIIQGGLLTSHTLTISAESMTAIQIAGNKAITRRFMEEVWNKGNMAAADELIAEDFVNHNPFGDLPPNREGLKIVATDSAAMSPNSYTVDDIIVEGNKVAFRNRFHGNPEFEAIVILYIKDGKVTDRWGYSDHDQKFAEANKALIRRYFEALSGKEKPAATVEEYVGAQDDALKQHIAMFEAAFPHYELIAENMIAEGDKVAVHARFQGTQTGAFGDVPPTGKQVSQPFMITYRIANGKIVEHWMNFDQLALMQQLGVIPR